MLVVENLSRSEINENIQYNYSYRIIKDKISFSEYDELDIQSYGIEVERQDLVDGKLFKVERELIKCISPHRHKVHNLIKMLYDNLVSPIHVVDIVGEYIDDYITDYDEILKDIYIC